MARVSHRSRETAVRLTTMLTAALVLGPAGAALAHAHLVRSIPAANSTISAAPNRLWLTFTVAIRPTVSGVRLTGPDGRRTMLSPLTWDPRDIETVSAPLPARLAPGRYLVEWSALDPNAHRTRGAFAFTIAH